MNFTLSQKIADALQTSYGGEVRIAVVTPAAGSSFSNTARLTLQSGEVLFVKHASKPPPGIFQSEYKALRLLHDTHALQVPEPLCSGNEFSR